MIIKTLRPHANASRLGRYLTHDSKENERIADLGTRGTVAADTVGALKEMAASRFGARCQQPLYHVVFNPAKGEQLTADQWERALAIWERTMGLADRQRAIVQHQKDGRWHTHVVYNRIDPLTGKAVNIGRDHFSAKSAAREIERELGLQRVSDKRRDRRREQQPPLKWEAEQTRRTKVDTHKIRDHIAAAWAVSDTGRSFQRALDTHCLSLARGETRPYVVVDEDGNFFALSGRVLPHTKMKDIRAKLADLALDTLPTLEEARQRSHELARAQKAADGGTERERPKPVEREIAPERPRTTEKEAFQREHRDLTRHERAAKEQQEKSVKKLARAQEAERLTLAEKQRDRWWHWIFRKSEQWRREEARARAELEERQALERAALQTQLQLELQTIEARRAELRRLEKQARDADGLRTLEPKAVTRERSREDTSKRFSELARANERVNVTHEEYLRRMEERTRTLQRQREQERAKGRGRGLEP